MFKFSWLRFRVLSAAFLLGIGVGLLEATLVLVKRVLLDAFPYRDPSTIARLSVTEASLDSSREIGLSPAQLRKLSTLGQSLVDSFGSHDLSHEATIEVRGQAVEASACNLSGTVFEVLGVKPQIGRVFDEEKGPTAIVSSRFWTKHFSEERVGQVGFRSGGLLYTVIGVMPRRFFFPDESTEIWFNNIDESLNYPSIVRLRDPSALSALRMLLGEFSKELSGGLQLATDVERFDERILSDVRSPLIVSLGVSVLLLLSAMTSVLNLELTHLHESRTSQAIRTALGEPIAMGLSRYALRCLVIALTTASVSFAFARFLAWFLTTASPYQIPRIGQIDFQTDLLVLAVGAALLIALTLLAASLLFQRRQSLGALWTGARTQSRKTFGFRRATSIVQVGISTVVLWVGCLAAFEFYDLRGRSLGYEADRLSTAQVRLRRSQYQSKAAVDNLLEDILARMSQAFASAAFSTALPMGGFQNEATVSATDNVEHSAKTAFNEVSPSYFRTMGMKLHRGRFFTAEYSGIPPAVVNRTLARLILPDLDPLGKTIQVGSNQYQIVAVAEDVRQISLDLDPLPEVIVPFSAPIVPAVRTRMYLEGRTAGSDPRLEAFAIVATDLNPDLRVVDVQTQESRLERFLAPPRFWARVAAISGLLALSLTIASIASLTALLTAARSREFAIRMAVGSSPKRILLLVLRSGLWWTLLGLSCGVVACWMIAKVLESLVPQVGQATLSTLAIVVVIVVTTTIMASWFPARQAGRADPVHCLKG